jgi:N-carbamoylputrescine amidase
MAQRWTVAAIQMRMSADKEENLARAEAAIAEAARRGAHIVCLPELFTGYYFCQVEDPAYFDQAEPIPGPSETRLARAAQKYQVIIIGSLFEKRLPGIYHNTATVHNHDGQLLGIYRKMHIPEDPLYFEKYYFTPGDTGFCVFPTSVATVGPLVCWDQWFPEAARLTTLRGADILCYPTAIGWHPREKAAFGKAQHEAWETIMRAHAIANGVYVCAVNRVGHEVLSGEGLEFWGGSFLCDPFGRILAKASHDQEEILLAECDRRLLEEVRRHWPFLRDRRIDAYEGLTRRAIDSPPLCPAPVFNSMN